MSADVALHLWKAETVESAWPDAQELIKSMYNTQIRTLGEERYYIAVESYSTADEWDCDFRCDYGTPLDDRLLLFTKWLLDHSVNSWNF